ncbi:type II toxin-antitoxin system prevent-host-death family antitoxin [Rubrimonas cliftonensis]|uniref:Antitoxin n=1 Tax=Rubrimonas cliftonensis TaxID=89524 RepID=A0A1H4FUY6_9RHOB|nr:type II toxin-antitoxin system prevent-host-death family antitoxin [Rubrimonas cliftonensis]SEB00660.1 prevent-host-death family protein [Rubrimonas cliftonensis]
MSWSLQDAKNRFSAVVEAALRQGPQAVTRRGRPAVTVIATAEYEGLRRAAAASRPDFRAHLLAIPPAEAGAADEFPRAGAAPRAVDLS